MLRRFDLAERGSTPAAEVRGAFATFLTMAYILFANPSILSAAGVPFAPAAAATAAAAAICCILMGVVANFPIALASGMGAQGAYALLPEELHQPLRQRMALTKSAGATARALYEYLQQPAARAIFDRYGFMKPAER